MIWRIGSAGDFRLSGTACLGLVALWSLAPPCRMLAADCVSAPAGLVSWWPGDGNANDLAGGNTATLQGGATAIATGMAGSAFSFDGANSYVQVPDSPTLKPTNITIEAWVRFASLDSPGNTADPGQQYIIFKQNSRSGSFEGYDLGKARVTGGDAFVFRTTSAAGALTEVRSQTLLTTGVWYHVAGVRGPSLLQLYVNGQLEAQTSVSSPLDYGTLPLYFGTSGQSYWDRKFNGTLDEISIYSRALASNEIAAIYSASTAGKCKGASITAQPQSQMLAVGATGVLSVTATGYGVLGYQWRFNGTNIAGAGNSGLTLNNVQPTNAGSYTVVVTNSLAAVTSAPAVLTVLGSPFITGQPVSRTNECSSVATFALTAGGSAPLGYQWYFNGSAISGATGTSLSVSNVHSTDQGTYGVVVTNAVGSVTNTPAVTLTVRDTLPPSLTVLGASPLTNECHAAFVDPGATANDSCAGSVAVVTNGTVNPNAVGVYTISYFVTDLSSNVASSSRTVYVIDRTAPIVTMNGANPFTNECHSPFVDPGATATDSCAGSLAVTTNGVVNANAAGTYTVRYTATDPSGNSATNSRTVYVIDRTPPVIILNGPNPLTNQYLAPFVDPGATANDACAGSLTVATNSNVDPNAVGVYTTKYIAGDPSGNFATNTRTVYVVSMCPPIALNPASLPAGALITFYSQTLTASGGAGPYTFALSAGALPAGLGLTSTGILSGTPTALGTANFTVTATDTNGCAGNRAYTLEVTGTSPVITAQPFNQTNLAGTAAGFTVTASGYAPLRYQWQFNGANSAGETNASLIIDPVQLTNTGQYRVIVTNTAGSVTSLTATLTVWVPPVITAQPQNVTTAAGSTANYGVTAFGVPSLTYQWRLNGKDLPGVTTSALSIGYVIGSPCNPGAPRSYSVVVSNAAGVAIGGPATLTVIEASPGSPVSISDPNLEAVIRSSLSKPTGPLWVSNLWSLRSLTACWQHITNLYGLEYATNLLSLQLSGNGIIDLTPIRCMNQLTHLGLDHNCISDASPLSGLTTLSNLNVAKNALADGTPLSNLTGLTGLSLDGNSVGDISFLSSLGQLKLLSLSRNNIQGLSALTNLSNLSVLDIGGNLALTNFTALSRLTSLTSLSVRESFFDRLRILRGLTKLAFLDLGNAYQLRDVDSVTNLTALTTLDLSWDAGVTNTSLVGGATSLTNLYLRGISLTNAAFVTNLYRLSVLNVDSTSLIDASPLQRLTNLVHLAMTGNAGVSNLTALSNLKALTSLELRADSISNVAFLSGLTQLKYLDLACNGVTNIVPLVNLTNLDSLVLAGNPTNSYAGLSGNKTLNNLWLFDAGLGDLSSLTQLGQLRYLDLEGNALTSIAPLTALTNLTGLGLSRNPISDYSVLAAFTNLTSLRVDGNALGSASFVTNLTGLNSLSLGHNRISDLSPLATLSKLNDLYLTRNRISSIDSLQALPRLVNADLRLNLLDLSNQSPAAAVVKNLTAQGETVATNPQNQAPRLLVPFSQWFVPANGSSSLSLSVWEDALPSGQDLVVNATSSNSNLVSLTSSLLLGSNYSRTLSVQAGAATGQSALLTVTATDDVLMSSYANIQVGVVDNTAVSSLCPNLDPASAAAIAFASRKTFDELTTVDLLMLQGLTLQDATLNDSCIWHWITNLTSLSLSGSSITNLTLLTNLTHLTSLSVATGSPVDLSPLAMLPNLKDLYLYGGAISHLDFLTNLTQLRSLTAYKTHVADLSPLAGLTNLQWLRLQQNRLTNISAVASLSQLVFANLSLNLFDLSPTSPAMIAIQTAMNRGATVLYLPPRLAPVIDMNTNWVIAANTPSWLYFLASDDAPARDLSVSAFVANTNLIGGMALGEEITPFSDDWFLNLRSGSNQVGSTTITVTATNDAGLVSSKVVSVVVEQPLPLNGITFSDPNLTAWTTGSNAAWFGQTSVSHLGPLAAKSGSITNNADSWMQTTVVGPGTMSFWWKVSSETNYDILHFCVGTNEEARISGEVDWNQQTFTFAPGTYSLMWKYSKDTDTSRGMDSGWVADISFTPVSWLAVGDNPGAGSVQLTIYGQVGKVYQLMYSTNLVTWLPLSTVTATNGPMTFVDVTAGPGARYYRLQ
jgi:Leucine-rich repeat (LRR) protein